MFEDENAIDSFQPGPPGNHGVTCQNVLGHSSGKGCTLLLQPMNHRSTIQNFDRSDREFCMGWGRNGKGFFPECRSYCPIDNAT